jgi:hypothetical protein
LGQKVKDNGPILRQTYKSQPNQGFKFAIQEVYQKDDEERVTDEIIDKILDFLSL